MSPSAAIGGSPSSSRMPIRRSIQEVYCDLLAEQAGARRVEIWAYCPMPNHVHLIAAPKDRSGLGRAIGEAHRRYTKFSDPRGRWTGHLFQSRFASVPMDEAHLIAAVRYVSLNPVRARLGGAGGRVAVVQRARASLRPRRRIGACRSGAAARARFRGAD
jgi:REP element-mobilizing transposase RayT